MAGLPVSLWLPWAVHISDGVLTVPWLAGGFAVAALLVLLASFRVRDEEIPRIAVLSSAFFVATLMHLRLGPTSVHLLLNGLVGVVLGRRAPLAILIGLALQAALLGHGGFYTLGINTCVLTLPALLAGGMFASLCRLPKMRQQTSATLWIFGCIIGMTSVLATLVLNAVVLFWGGAEDWSAIVWFVFYAHLPIVGLEGIVLGFTVSFLGRVKPEMLGIKEETLRKWHAPEAVSPVDHAEGIAPPRSDLAETVSTENNRSQSPLPSHPPALLFAAFTILLTAGPARAHLPEADFTVLPDRKIRIEGWFDPGADPMKGAKVQVFRPDNHLLVQGQMDDEGRFVFQFEVAEQLEVVVSAGAGHRKSFIIPREKLDQRHVLAIDSDPSQQQNSLKDAPSSIDRHPAWGERFKDALLGVTFLLALSAFLLSWRNARKLKS
jgi:cobalt/nickel transport system permease protein